jgi:hypothetical protein
MSPKKRHLSDFLGMLCLWCWVIGIGLKFSFYVTGSTKPDSTHSYSTQLHGTMYVDPCWGALSDALMALGAFVFAATAIATFLENRADKPGNKKE